MGAEPRAFRPQAGPQERALACSADILVYGGAAGGGKSWALLLEPTRHHANPDFRAAFFRRTMPKMLKAGSLWDEAQKIYRGLKARFTQRPAVAFFPSGARIEFNGCEHEADVEDYQGAQYAFIGFDELTQFTEHQFFYLIGRTRSMSGVKPYIRATCNPDPDSFVAKLIEWWIDQETGFPIEERAGVVRYLFRHGDDTHWGDTREDLIDLIEREGMLGDDDGEPNDLIYSFTFIPAKVSDNKKLLEVNPQYRAALQSQNYVQRARLKDGNWLIRESRGTVFKAAWFPIVLHVNPAEIVRAVRYWDLGSPDDGDYTCGVLVGIKRPQGDEPGTMVVLDVKRFRGSTHEQEQLFLSTARADGKRVAVWFEQEAGAAAQHYIRTLARKMRGFRVKGNYVTKKGNKLVRASEWSGPVERGEVQLLNGAWNGDFTRELEAFPEGANDDQVDAFSGACERVSDGGFWSVSV